jgi:hypothetical protein
MCTIISFSVQGFTLLFLRVTCHLNCIVLINETKTLNVKFYFTISYVNITLKCLSK